MPHETPTRRAFLATAAPAFLAACSPGAGGPAKPASPATIGIATLGFGELSNAQLAGELAAAGIKTIQLFLNQTDSKFWKYNGRTDLAPLTPEACRAIAAPYRAAGIRIHSIGVYTNLIHPDPAERAANLAYFEGMMQVARHMDVDTLITEAGHFHDPEKPEPPVPLHFQEAVWHQMVATGKDLAALAERHNVKILFEGFYRGFLCSAKRIRLFLDAVGSPRVRSLLDPANLIEINDLDEMFAQLAPWIDCLHAKDRKLHVDRGVAAGQGDVDYLKFVTLAASRTPHAPLILEYVGPKDYRQAHEHLQNALRQAGLA